MKSWTDVYPQRIGRLVQTGKNCAHGIWLARNSMNTVQFGPG